MSYPGQKVKLGGKWVEGRRTYFPDLLTGYAIPCGQWSLTLWHKGRYVKRLDGNEFASDREEAQRMCDRAAREFVLASVRVAQAQKALEASA